MINYCLHDEKELAYIEISNKAKEIWKRTLNLKDIVEELGILRMQALYLIVPIITEEEIMQILDEWPEDE